MRVPKKAYRDKVRRRLRIVQMVFEDRPYFEKMIRQHEGRGAGKSDFHNKMESFYMLLGTDVPALLDAFEEENETNRVQESDRGVGERSAGVSASSSIHQ